MITKPFRFSGRRLTLNYSTSALGPIRVEFLNPFSRPIFGLSLANSEEIYGDELDRDAIWNGRSDVGQLACQIVRLGFIMRDADLYAFRFVE